MENEPKIANFVNKPEEDAPLKSHTMMITCLCPEHIQKSEMIYMGKPVTDLEGNKVGIVDYYNRHTNILTAIITDENMIKKLQDIQLNTLSIGLSTKNVEELWKLKKQSEKH